MKVKTPFLLSIFPGYIRKTVIQAITGRVPESSPGAWSVLRSFHERWAPLRHGDDNATIPIGTGTYASHWKTAKKL